MAVEDAGALGILMGKGISPKHVPERLQLFQQVRSNRSCAMQILSNWLLHGLDTVLKQADPYMDGVKLSKTYNIERDAFQRLTTYTQRTEKS